MLMTIHHLIQGKTCCILWKFLLQHISDISKRKRALKYKNFPYFTDVLSIEGSSSCHNVIIWKLGYSYILKSLVSKSRDSNIDLFQSCTLMNSYIKIVYKTLFDEI